MYVHSNGGTIDLIVTGQGISHFAAGYQGLHSDHIKLINTNSKACTHSWMHYGPHGDGLILMSNFIADHHSHSGVHVMHHRTNNDACTLFWR